MKQLTNVHPTAKIAPTAIIGAPYRPLLSGTVPHYSGVEIGANAFIGHYVVIGAGCRIDEGSIIDDFSKLECGIQVGRKSLIQYRAHICNEVTIGSDCVIGGFLTERVTIGNGSRVFGSVIHAHKDTSRGWDDDEAREPSAKIGQRVFVGFGACVIGKVTLEDGAYIAANAVVTQSVPAGHIVLPDRPLRMRG